MIWDTQLVPICQVKRLPAPPRTPRALRSTSNRTTHQACAERSVGLTVLPGAQGKGKNEQGCYKTVQRRAYHTAGAGRSGFSLGIKASVEAGVHSRVKEHTGRPEKPTSQRKAASRAPRPGPPPSPGFTEGPVSISHNSDQGQGEVSSKMSPGLFGGLGKHIYVRNPHYSTT